WPAGDMLTSFEDAILLPFFSRRLHRDRDEGLSLPVATAGLLTRPFERTICQRPCPAAVRECTPVLVPIRQVPNRARYSVGDTPSRRRKLRRIVSSEPNPHRTAIRLTDVRLSERY